MNELKNWIWIHQEICISLGALLVVFIATILIGKVIHHYIDRRDHRNKIKDFDYEAYNHKHFGDL